MNKKCEHGMPQEWGCDDCAIRRQHERIAELERVLGVARKALNYHTEQTRPISKTEKAIAEIDAALAKEKQ